MSLTSEKLPTSGPKFECIEEEPFSTKSVTHSGLPYARQVLYASTCSRRRRMVERTVTDEAVLRV